MNVMKFPNYIFLKINNLRYSVLCHSVFVGLLHKFEYSCNAWLWVTLNFTCVYMRLWRTGVFVLGEQQIWQVCRSMFWNAAYGRVNMQQEAIVRSLNAFVASWNCYGHKIKEVERDRLWASENDIHKSWWQSCWFEITLKHPDVACNIIYDILL